MVVMVAVAALVVWRAQQVDWAKVASSLRSYRAVELAAALALSALGYTVLCSFDLLGRHYTRHQLANRLVAAIAFVSYAFNINFSASIGGLGLRLRLYSRYGLKPWTIVQVFALSVTSNWLAYALLGGILLAPLLVPLSGPFVPPAGYQRILGVVLLAAIVAYVVLCIFMRGQRWRFRDLELSVPSARLAALQLSLGCMNWLVVALIIYVLLREQAPYLLVLAVLLVSCIAAMMTHIPAGLGVLEIVFVTLLRGRMAEPDVLAALVLFRAVYHLLPLALASVLYFALEGRARSTAPG